LFEEQHMIETVNAESTVAERVQAQNKKIIEGIYAGAQPGAVFSAPVVAGAFTIITAREVTVAEPPDHVERDERGRPRAYLDQQEEAHTRAARKYLNEIVHQLTEVRPELEVSTQVLMGNVTESIVTAVAGNRADLIVMSGLERTGMRRAAAGSVAGAVLARAGVPVLLVPPVAASTPPEHVPVGAEIR
jgi:nucleotide-binding universal stress UspA family protein